MVSFAILHRSVVFLNTNYCSINHNTKNNINVVVLGATGTVLEPDVK